jgi:hypothetical protein
MGLQQERKDRYVHCNYVFYFDFDTKFKKLSLDCFKLANDRGVAMSFACI